MDERTMIETLAHEWAHARVWKAPTKLDHGARWGIEHAKTWRILFDGIHPKRIPHSTCRVYIVRNLNRKEIVSEVGV